ncbi:MAG: cbb3-type cytochrome c oxidase subunit I, partial [Rhizobiales bacterium]|nr:cbb3-type cytochrome c oxidase subunit I [Hyphomicrobiales bacterium]
MVAELTKNERQGALVILLALAITGLAMAAGGRGDPFGVHGALVLVTAIVGIFAVISGYYAPEPSPDRLDSYYDTPTKFGIIAAMVWAVIGMAVGDWVAWLLAYPEWTFDAAWASFGRLRPVHTSGVIFGFGGNALIATSFYVMQRTSRARLPDQLTPWFVLFGYNLFCVIAATGYLMGVTQSKEYAEPEWYADIWLVIVWVVYFVLYLRTLNRRKEPHIYVSNWYYLAFILVVAMLHIVNNLAVPISWGSAKSYSLFSGVQDAMTEWWYGHNAVAFFLTSGFLGMMYYYMPKRAGRPIYSYRMSIISFWGITFFYMWAGSHHLHYTALPQWVQSLGMTFSVMLLVPSWVSAGNALMTLNGAWHKVRDDAVLRFMMVAAVFYGLSTFEGSFMAIRPVNALSHYTDWTVGHVHAGALGWVAMITFGAIYASVPWLWKR